MNKCLEFSLKMLLKQRKNPQIKHTSTDSPCSLGNVQNSCQTKLSLRPCAIENKLDDAIFEMYGFDEQEKAVFKK